MLGEGVVLLKDTLKAFVSCVLTCSVAPGMCGTLL